MNIAIGRTNTSDRTDRNIGQTDRTDSNIGRTNKINWLDSKTNWTNLNDHTKESYDPNISRTDLTDLTNLADENDPNIGWTDLTDLADSTDLIDWYEYEYEY